MSGYDPYETAQALITACLAGDPDSALALFDDLLGPDYDHGATTSTARLATLSLALTEIATTMHLAWASVLGLDRADAIEEWSRMIAAAYAARTEREEEA